MTTTMARHGTHRLAVLAGAAAFTAGVPALLSEAAGWPLPHRIPGLAEISDSIANGWRPDADTMVKTFAIVAWIAWAQITAATLGEIRGRRSNRTPARLPLSGWCRPLAVRLAATILTVTPVLTPRIAGASTLPTASAVVAVTPADPATSPVADTATTPASGPSAGETVIHVVRPGDTLWDLARDHLGDPLRWREVFDLNRGRPQSGGDQLDDPGLLRPGWQLHLPVPTAPAPAPPGGLESDAAAADTSEPETAPPPTNAAGPALVSDPTGDPGVIRSTSEPPVDDTGSIPPAAAAAGVETQHDNPTASGSRSVPPGPPPGPAADIAAKTGPVVAPGPDLALHGPDISAAAVRSGSAEDAPSRGAGPVAGVGIPAMMAGAFLGYLGGLRRDRERWRRRHHRFADPEPAQMDMERHVRAVPGAETVTWVDLALRHLADALTEDGAPPPPDVLAVRAGALGVEVLLSRPWPVTPGRFIPIDDGHVWRLDPAVDLDELVPLAHGVPYYLPALATIGETDAGSVLVDLDHVGSLAVNGDPDHVRAVLERLALELATLPWADTVEIYTVGAGDALVGLERVRTLEAETAAVTLRRLAGHPGPGGLAAAASCDIPPGPTVAIIAPGALSPTDLADLLDAAQPHGGLIVVAGDAGPTGRWQLAVTATGDALLAPLGLALRITPNAETTVTLQEILADHAARDTDLPADEPSDPPTTATPETQRQAAPNGAADPDGAAASKPEPAPLVEVRVLGPIEFIWPAETPRPQVAELVAYFATHPPAVGAERARLALWPPTVDDERFGERSPATFWNLTSKVRAALGTDANGQQLLQRSATKTFSLAEGVACDLTRFRRLTERARRQPDQAATLLASALALVRGRPFQDPPPGYGWVDVERLDDQIAADIADAALDLVDLCLTDHEPDLTTARWAVRQGLLGAAHSEPLLCAEMRVAGIAGDLAGIERAWRDIRRLAGEFSATGEPEPATVALYRELRRPPGAA